MSPKSPEVPGWKKSWNDIKYPSLRDYPERSADTWLQGKILDDNAEGLWRVHNKLYDLTPFLDTHPGGRSWLELTKGLDVTEAFESHHITDKASNILPQFYVRDAIGSRNSPFTFDENGFYRTLKRRIAPVLPELRKTQSKLSAFYADMLLVIAFLSGILCVRFQSYFLAIISGMAIGWLTVLTHNFFHMRDNFRMHYFNLSVMSFREWRISHVLSHHLHPNTLKDMEISALEPFFPYLPGPKNFLAKYFPVYTIPIYFGFFFTQALKRIYRFLTFQHRLELHDFVPLTLPMAMFLCNNSTFGDVFGWWAIMIAISSFNFVSIGVNAAHHHPDIFHEGDAVRVDRDWGLHQLDAVADNTGISGNSFLVLTHFGEHSLHHLFPTLDHTILPQLLPIVVDTCKEFNVKLRYMSRWELVKGQFKQLARTETKNAPIYETYKLE